jgi:hypothetical protein
LLFCIQLVHNGASIRELIRRPVRVPPLLPPLPVYGLPGRGALLHQLKERLFSGGNVVVCAEDGLAGIGKTAVAVAIAHDPEIQAHFRDSILWAGLGLEPGVAAVLDKWALELHIPLSVTAPLTCATKADLIGGILSSCHTLIVLDDACQVETAGCFQLGGPHCVHLVTTRLPQVAAWATPEEACLVGELDCSAAGQLLACAALTAVHREPAASRWLVENVVRLPLALILLGCYLGHEQSQGIPTPVAGAVEELVSIQEQQRASDVTWEQIPDSGDRIGLQAILALVDQHLDEAGRRAWRALSLFPPKPGAFSAAGALSRAAVTLPTLKRLAGRGLVTCAEPGRYYLHPTVAAYGRRQANSVTSYQ